MAIAIFIVFVVLVIGLSFFLGNKTKTSSGYYAAGGKIHWGVNGIAFAGDYLSAASFLGICGLIATLGFDGFLYSIGYLAGWVVALFVVAEPLKGWENIPSLMRLTPNTIRAASSWLLRSVPWSSLYVT